MTLKVLVPLDVVDAAHPALVTARALLPGAALTLLHVSAPHVPVVPGPSGALVHAALALQHAEEEHVAQAREALLGLQGGEVTASNDPAGEILRRAAEHDLVWMGTARRGQLERLVLGSVAERVVKEAPVPVVTVSASDEPRPAPAGPPRALLLHDFSAPAQAALDFLRERWPQVQVELLHVVDPSALATPFDTGVMPAGRSITPRDLDRRNRAWQVGAQERLDALGGGRVRLGEPVALALQLAAQGGHDLIALGRSSKGPLARLMFGSTARRMVRESPIPVLTAGPG